MSDQKNLSHVALSVLLAHASKLIIKKYDVGLGDSERAELTEINAELDGRKSYNITPPGMQP